MKYGFKILSELLSNSTFALFSYFHLFLFFLFFVCFEELRNYFPCFRYSYQNLYLKARLDILFNNFLINFDPIIYFIYFLSFVSYSGATHSSRVGC